MASDSDMFDYLLPSKRRKYSISSSISHKSDENIENLLHSNELSCEISEKEDKHYGFNIEQKVASQIYEQYSPTHIKNVESDMDGTLKYETTGLNLPETNDTTVSAQNDYFFEDCVNELMSKNGFLLPINPNHQEEDYYDEEDDDQSDEYDDEVDEDEKPCATRTIKPLEIACFKAKSRSIKWVRKQILAGVHPLEIRSLHLPHINDMLLWSIITRALSDPPRRMPLRHINRIEDVVKFLHSSQNIIVLTGAGVSVSCGIPDFRSRDGIYSRLAIDYPDLPDPQAMFCISYFNQDPRPFFKFAREIYPGQFKPSTCHRFIKLLEKKNKLLRNYTQNIDTLEQISGIENVIECHGSFATATCTKCRVKVLADDIREDIFEQRIPLCSVCNPGIPSPSSSDLNTNDNYKSLVWRGIMKPDIVFFGEDLPEYFHSAIDSDRKKCDLLIVIGSSLKVRPVALIPNSIPCRVPQILINRESLSHLDFDVELLGNSDTIINQLCHMLGEGWDEICFSSKLEECEKIKKPVSSLSSASPNSESNSVDYQSVMQMSIDSGFDSSSNPSSSSNSMISSSSQVLGNIQETDTQRNFTTVNASSDRLHSPKAQKLKKENQSIERHMSFESAKDSGISGSSSSSSTYSEDEKCLGCKKSIAELLPLNTYCRYRCKRYIFPGAEIYWESDDDSDNDESSRNCINYEDEDSIFGNETGNLESEIHTTTTTSSTSNFTLKIDNNARSCNLNDEQNTSYK